MVMGILGGDEKGDILWIELEDNAASREFVAQLPLSLEFSDYVGKEKKPIFQSP